MDDAMNTARVARDLSWEQMAERTGDPRAREAATADRSERAKPHGPERAVTAAPEKRG